MKSTTLIGIVLVSGMLSGCDTPDGDGNSPVPNALTYSVHLEEQSQVTEQRLIVDLRRRLIVVDRLEYGSERRRRDLGDEDLAKLLLLFSNERAWIYSADTSREDGTNPPGLDCSQAQESADDATICRAQEIGQLKVFAMMSMAAEGPMKPGLYGDFFFQAPVDLSLESAEAIVFLEDMRLRTEEEGTLIGGE